MKSKISVSVIVLLAGAGILAGQTSSGAGRRFDNQYLSMTILRGWTVGASADPTLADPTLNVVRDQYLLAINPVFTHASPVEGGRFGEIVEQMPSVRAVMLNVDGPASGDACALSSPGALRITKSIALGNLYTDSSKTGNGCVFPSGGGSVWFGSFSVGSTSQSEYTIKLSYRTDDVNALPRRGSAQLEQVFAEVVAMLKTLHFKRPIVISRISPAAALPGATVTIYGTGFILGGQTAGITLLHLPDATMPDPVVTPDGRSLTFQVPTSIEIVSCQPGRISIAGFCLPIPANHVDLNDCPRRNDDAANFCGIPVPPGIYQISVGAGGLSGDSVSFTIIPLKPGPVTVSLMYPTSLVSPGDTITVRGSGFTPSGNNVRMGSAVASDLHSADGKTLTFRAPDPEGNAFIPSLRMYKASVLNADGESTSILFQYR
jgi:IPT/TIG domain